jgi:hypothetical protein
MAPREPRSIVGRLVLLEKERRQKRNRRRWQLAFLILLVLTFFLGLAAWAAYYWGAELWSVLLAGSQG